MSTYHAPLADMHFVMNELAGLEQVGKLPGFEDATPETVRPSSRKRRSSPPTCSIR